MITIHQRHRRTDGRTDRQTTCDGNTALCTKVHGAVKMKASIMISSPSGNGNPTILVFWCQISSQTSKGFPRGGLKQGWGGKIQRFSGFKRQYLENGNRYGQSYYWSLIESRIWAFVWHQDRWPWMTLNCCKVNFFRNFAGFCDFGRQQPLNEWRWTYNVSDGIVAH